MMSLVLKFQDTRYYKKLKYKLTMYVLGLYVGIYSFFAIKSRFTPPPPITFESKEEEDFVKKYIQHMEHESHKPKLLRTPYSGPSGVN